MTDQEKQLKEFLLDSGLITEADYESAEGEALKSKGKLSAGHVLINIGKISENDFRRAEAYVLGIPFVSLKDQKIPADVLALIPEPVARKNNAIAYKKMGDTLEVAMLDTKDLSSIEFIKKKVGLRILPRLTDSDSIKVGLLQYQKSLRAEFGDIIQKDATALQSLVEGRGTSGSGEDLKKMAEDLPVIRILDTLLKHAILQNASDIHIEALENELLVRYRIDGILHDAMVLPKSVSASVIARIKVLASLKLDEKRLPQDGRFKIEVNNEKVSFRVSILPTYFGEKAVMRLLRENASGFTLEAMGFHGEALEVVHEAIKQTTGLILTTGPTGSGKTTTLYTMLDILNTPDVNISTIEDPVEYQMNRINQTQVKPEIGFTFANGLRSLVRQDPDIIMVGEIRDNETASLAINAALTGHLVLSTLHTNSAAGAMPRLIDMKIEPFLIVSTAKVIIAQRLLRRLSDNKEKYFLSKAEIDSLSKVVDVNRVLNFLKKEKVVGAEIDNIGKVPFCRPIAVGESRDGYSGRVCINEVLKMTPTIKELVVRGEPDNVINEQAKKEGMMSMIEDGIFKAAQGVTTIEEVLRVISE
jgi:type IV pilus assembly protein PilB